jgi:hypothetical protein
MLNNLNQLRIDYFRKYFLNQFKFLFILSFHCLNFDPKRFLHFIYLSYLYLNLYFKNFIPFSFFMKFLYLYQTI